MVMMMMAMVMMVMMMMDAYVGGLVRAISNAPPPACGLFVLFTTGITAV